MKECKIERRHLELEAGNIKMQMEIVKDFLDRSEIEIKTGPFGTQLKAAEYELRGTPVLNVKNLGFSTINKEKLDKVGDATIERLKVHLLKVGDIVFGRKGAVERHAFISVNEEGWMQGSDCIRLRVKTDKINPRFLSYYFLTKEHRAFMIGMCSHGTTMASLNQKILEQMRFPVPERSIQDKIVDILERFDRKIALNNRINGNLPPHPHVVRIAAARRRRRMPKPEVCLHTDGKAFGRGGNPKTASQFSGLQAAWNRLFSEQIRMTARCGS